VGKFCITKAAGKKVAGGYADSLTFGQFKDYFGVLIFGKFDPEEVPPLRLCYLRALWKEGKDILPHPEDPAFDLFVEHPQVLPVIAFLQKTSEDQLA
jgi:hypothetical protein